MKKLLLICLLLPQLIYSETVDLVITAGQSNAGRDNFAWAKGIEDALSESGSCRFENLCVISTFHGGRPLNEWYDEGEQVWYEEDFFNAEGTGALQATIDNLTGAGYDVNFVGLFWFQGESDGLERHGGSAELYPERWEGMINQLDSDIGHSDWGYVMNTVGNSGDAINNALTSITDSDTRGLLFDTQVEPYRTDPDDIHGYDHYAVGQGNAELFLIEYCVPELNTLSYVLGLSLLPFRRKRPKRKS